MATEAEIYRIIVETQGGRELLALNRTVTTTTQSLRLATREAQALASPAGLGGYTVATRTAARGTSQFGNSLRNSSYQVNDFFTQIAFGTNAVTALSLQLPQLLQGFGRGGPIIAAAAAALGALYIIFSKNKKTTDEARQAIDDYTSSVSGLESFVRDTIDVQGALNEAIQSGSVRNANLLQRELEARRALIAVKEAEIRLERARVESQLQGYQETIANIKREIQEQLSTIDFTDATGGFARTQAQSAALAATQAILQENQQVFLELRKINAEYDLSNIQLEQIDDLMRDLDRITANWAANTDAAAAALGRVKDAVEGLSSAMRNADVSGFLASVELAAIRAGKSLDDAKIARQLAEARLEAQAMLGSTDAAVRAAAQANLGELEKSLRSTLEIENQLLEARRNQEALTRPSGGGGAREARDTTESYRLLKAAIESTYTPVERARQEAELLAAALQDAAATEELFEQYPEGLQRVQEKIAELRGTTASWITDVKDIVGGGIDETLEGVILKTKKVEDAFRDMVGNIFQYMNRLISMKIADNILGILSGPGGIPGLRSVAVPSGASPIGRSGGVEQMRMITARAAVPSMSAMQSQKSAAPTVNMPINVYNEADVQVLAERRDREIAIIVRDVKAAVEAKFSRSLATGHGPYSEAIERNLMTRRRY